MARIAGVELPNTKRLDIALTYLYGIGRSNVIKVIESVNIDPSRRVNTLSDEEVSKITKVIEKGFMIEGDLRQQVASHIKRLREISSYRGIRHTRKLPSRGQRTRSNARTRRGKRVTIGAMKKDDRQKLDKPQAAASPAASAAPVK